MKPLPRSARIQTELNQIRAASSGDMSPLAIVAARDFETASFFLEISLFSRSAMEKVGMPYFFSRSLDCVVLPLPREARP